MSATEPKLVSLREHPRAAPAIRRLKAYGGLAGFAIAFVADAERLRGVIGPVLRALHAAHEQPQAESERQTVREADVPRRSGQGREMACDLCSVPHVG